MSYSSTFAKRGARPCIDVQKSASHLTRHPNRNERPEARDSETSPTAKVVPSGPEGHQCEALQEMILSSRRRFVRLAYSILWNMEDAEDAVQDALLSAFRHLRGFEGRSALTTWFTRVVLNAALMIRRKRKPGRIEPLPESDSSENTSGIELIPDSQPDPETACAKKETFLLIDSLLGTMSPPLRQAFTMTYYQEMSNEQAAALLGITTGTFKSRIFRARQHLAYHAQRALGTPRSRKQGSSFSFGSGQSMTIAAMPVEISSAEVAFS